MTVLDSSAYLISASLEDQAREYKEYPFDLPAIRGFEGIHFHPDVTFFVGENGSGKSTLVEALAIASGFNPEGGTRNFNFSTRDTHSELYKHLKLVRGVKRPKDGFFLRAESFYNVATMIDELNDEPGLPPLMAAYGSKSLHQQSHGESFMSLIRHRFRGSGLYIMDEPEAALSVARQLEFLALMHQLTQKGSQLIIATHSPVLLSYPNATIYQIDSGGMRIVAYEDTEQYQLMQYFLNNYKVMLRNIL